MLRVGHVKDRWFVTRDGEKVPSDRHGRGLRWQVWVSVDGRPKCGGSFRTKAIAERKLLELENSAARGQWVDPHDRTTVAELLRGYAAGRHYRPMSATRVESLIANHLDGHPFGQRRVVAVKPSEAQAWVADRARVLAPTTLRLLVSVVRSAFRAAVLDSNVAASPFERVTMPRDERDRVVPLTVDQVRAVAGEVPVKARAMVVAQAGLGLRIGELLALRAEDVDFLGREVRIEAQISRDTRKRVPPKTPRSRRVVPLPRVVANELAEHMRQFPPASDGTLFATPAGLPVSHGWYAQKVFRPAVDRLKLPAGTSNHDLRHHYASVLLAAGLSVVAVAELLGHENANLVLSTYGHLLPGGEELARRAVQSAWAAAGEIATTP